MMKQQTETTNGPRTALAKAIEDARDAEAHCEALRASVTRIQNQLYAAQGQLDRAREEDEEEKTEHVRRIVAGDDMAVLERPARSAVAEVERTIEACRQARDMVAHELAEAERSVGFKLMRVRDAAGDVVAAEALDKQIAEAERLRAEYDRASAVLRFLNHVAPQSYTDRIAAALSPTDERGEHASIAPWRAALAALMSDANAELPR